MVAFSFARPILCHKFAPLATSKQTALATFASFIANPQGLVRRFSTRITSAYRSYPCHVTV